MKKTTIAMIVIAVAGLLCGIGAVLFTMASAGKYEIVTIDATGTTASRNLPDFNSVTFDYYERNIYFCDTFPGMKVVIDPSVTVPTISAPEGVMDFITSRVEDGELLISFRADSTLYPGSERTRTNFELQAYTPVTVTVGKLPENIVMKPYSRLFVSGCYAGNDTLRIDPKHTLVLSDADFSNVAVSGQQRGNHGDFTFTLKGSTDIRTLAISQIRTLNISCDSTATLGAIRWLGTENVASNLYLDKGTVGQLDYTAAGNSSISVRSSSNLTVTF